jgi:hypothetical protein
MCEAQPRSAGCAKTDLLLSFGTHPIAPTFRVLLTFLAGAEVAFEIEPLRNETARSLPCSFGLIEAQAEILSDPPEGLTPDGTGIKNGEDQIEPTEVDTLELEPERAGLYTFFLEDSPEGPRTDVPTTQGYTAKRSAILHNWLPFWRVPKDWEVRHLFAGEGHIRMDERR